MKNIKILTVIAFIVFAMSNCKKCEYTSCGEDCVVSEDFNDDILNWKGSNTEFVKIDTNALTAESLNGEGAFIYDTTAINYPSNLAGAGCEFKYDVSHIFTNGTTPNVNSSLIIFNGPSSSPTAIAYFVLNASHAIYANANPAQSITVPLSLGSGTTLPSNTYGTWVINGGAPYVTSDIDDFNKLIQNISGLMFRIDGSGSMFDSWKYDNFCISDCCSDEKILID